MSRLYLSGIFFFILMYNGSNILPIARFLKYAHLKQAFRSTLSASELASRSVLCPMLPEANIFYLEVWLLEYIMKPIFSIYEANKYKKETSNSIMFFWIYFFLSIPIIMFLPFWSSGFVHDLFDVALLCVFKGVVNFLIF